MTNTEAINIRDYKYFNHHVGSDCYAFEVVEVISDRRVIVRKLDSKAGEGHDWYTDQNWELFSDERNPLVVITLRKNGRWYPKGQADWYCPYVPTHEPVLRLDPHF